MTLAESLLKHRHEGDFELSAGGRSKVYWDVRSALLEPFALSEYSDWVSDRYLGDESPFVEGPPEIAGISIGGALLIGAVLGWCDHLNGVVLRSGRKGHGLPSEWIGDTSALNGRKVLLLDDVLTTGSTLARVRTCLLEYFHAADVQCAVVLDRSRSDGQHPFPVDSMFLEEDLEAQT